MSSGQETVNHWTLAGELLRAIDAKVPASGYQTGLLTDSWGQCCIWGAQSVDRAPSA